MCDNQSANIRPVCQLFLRRQCKRGRSCRFLHVINIDRGDPVQTGIPAQNIESVTLTTEEVEASPEKSQRDGKSRPVCKHFARKGWCGFGRNCAFAHVRVKHDPVADVPETEESKNGIPTNLSLASGAGVGDRLELELKPIEDVHVKESSQGRSSASEIICKFFRAGYCRMGSKCHYKHAAFENRGHFRGQPKRGLRSNLDRDRWGTSWNKDDLTSIHSETSSDSGVVDDLVPRARKEVRVETINEVEEGKVMATGFKSNDAKLTAEEVMKNLRDTEIRQLKKRFPNAKETFSSENSTKFQFVFVPTDPDWPYDVKEINLQVEFPSKYPSEMMKVLMVEDEQIPETVQRLITEGIQEWVVSRYEVMKRKSKNDLAFRPLLLWLDKNAEELFTDALKAYRRERMAELAGVQFISADQLKRKYRFSGSEEQEKGEKKTTQDCDNGMEQNPDETEYCAASDENGDDDDVGEKENLSVDRNSVRFDLHSGVAERRGTEVSLQNLQLLNCAATLIATNVSLIIACSRCSNKSELKTNAGQPSKVDCPYCHNQQLITFRSSMAHQFSSVVGYLDLEGCDAFDMILSDCRFIINCLECSKDNKLEALPSGQLNTTWCFHCHNKLTLAVNNVRFVKLAASGAIDRKKACTVEVKGRVKAVKDPAIVEGRPLPDNGTCKHFKKSFRWFRFPCCGKAYPCDHCHDEREKDHEQLRANRIICGFCAKEQPYSSGHLCISCHANVTNKITAHWEGGTGCRDKIKMSRGDSKKYADSLKTPSRSCQNKKDPAKKVTKLRHL